MNITVSYCPYCKIPHEYCVQYSKDEAKCKAWLEENSPTLFKELFGVKEGEQEDAGEKKKKNKVKQKVKIAQGPIKVIVLKRGGKKVITIIQGLLGWVESLEAVAKQMGKKFATGAAVVTDEKYGENCVSIQGDVSKEFPLEDGEPTNQLLEFFKNELKDSKIELSKVDFEKGGNAKGRKQL